MYDDIQLKNNLRVVRTFIASQNSSFVVVCLYSFVYLCYGETVGFRFIFGFFYFLPLSLTASRSCSNQGCANGSVGASRPTPNAHETAEKLVIKQIL